MEPRNSPWPPHAGHCTIRSPCSFFGSFIANRHSDFGETAVSGLHDKSESPGPATLIQWWPGPHSSPWRGPLWRSMAMLKSKNAAAAMISQVLILSHVIVATYWKTGLFRFVRQLMHNAVTDAVIVLRLKGIRLLAQPKSGVRGASMFQLLRCVILIAVTTAIFATILRVLRHARRDRPEPRRLTAGRVRPHDAADVPLAVEHVVVVVRPCAAGAGFGCVFQNKHGSVYRWMQPRPRHATRRACARRWRACC
jgi:hypothetical protein